MTQRQIPFTIERWKEGLKPVTRDGREVKQLIYFNDLDSAYVLAGVVGSDLVRWKLEGGSSWADNYSLMLQVEVKEPREWLCIIEQDGHLSGYPAKYLLPGNRRGHSREAVINMSDKCVHFSDKSVHGNVYNSRGLSLQPAVA